MMINRLLKAILGFLDRNIHNESGIPKRFIAAILLLVLGFVALFLFVIVALVKVLWGWTIPELFPGAVSSGAIAGQISWLTALKLVILLMIIGSLLKGAQVKMQSGSKDGRHRVKQPPSGSPEPPSSDQQEPADAQTESSALLPLTGREIEVLRLLSTGLSNGQIASQIRVSERTVEFHISHIYIKLGVVSRVEAALWAKDRGLV